MSTWRNGLLIAAGVVLLAVGVRGSDALGLWMAQDQTTALSAGRALAGFAVTKDAATDVASSGSDTVQFTIGAREAQALVDAGPDGDGTFAVAVPFDVTMLASAGYGMDYTIDIATPQAGTVFDLPGKAAFFPVGDPGQCTVAEAGTAQTSVAPVSATGLASGAIDPHTQTDNWCLVVSVTPPTAGGTVSVDGINLLGDPESASASPWSGYVIPDPDAEPDLAVTLTPVPRAGTAA